ncbi:MAG: enoyl-CoA hydratase/isomerase family protein [Aestuariivita sp.]|nr:enoyl-CoA hydratase/isomerase family protein [Aestuariivita sp.]
MRDIDIRVENSTGRITLKRPNALNALTYDMCLLIEKALDRWREEDEVNIILIDAEGDRAFCAGGDISEIYSEGMKGNFAYAQAFWRDEYRLNAKIFEYPKPIISLMQGFTMGGGVGLGCHGTHRIVCEQSQISMPECTIGLVPDVGGSLMLTLAPGRLGEFLGMTGWRMGPTDAIYAGFADTFIPREFWPALTEQLIANGSVEVIDDFFKTPPKGYLENIQDEINVLFDGEALLDIMNSLHASNSEVASIAKDSIDRASPLSCACTIEIVHRLRTSSLTIQKALELEFRFTFRSLEHGDLMEGIRAQIIDKDRNPKWKYANGQVPTIAVSNMLLPLGSNKLKLK